MAAIHRRSVGQQDHRACKPSRSYCLLGFHWYRIHFQSAIVDFAGTGERRHGARITPQAERPIPALDGLDLSLEQGVKPRIV